MKFGTNPSTIFLVIVVTDRPTQTNAGKTYSLASAGRIMMYLIDSPIVCLILVRQLILTVQSLLINCWTLHF